MAIIFLGLAAGGFLVAARADLGRPLLSILAFRLTAQLAMTVGTGSVSAFFPSLRKKQHWLVARSERAPGAVSYTHLTLPTICSV
eukprot:5505653-Prymnesium_polylepis.1